MRSVSGSHRRTKRVSFHGMDCYSQPRLLGSLHVSSLQILSSLFFLPSFLPFSVRGMLRRFPRLYPSFALSSSSEFSESSPSVCFLDLPNSIRFRENSDNTMSRTRSLCVFLFPIKFSLNITIIFREILLLFLHAADPSEYFSFLRYPSSLSSSCL